MIFNSIDFLIFFAVVIPVYFCMPQRFRWALLLVASYYFYAYSHVEYLLMLIVPTLVVYLVSLALGRAEQPARRKVLLVTGLVSSLAVLVFFKYTDFIGRSLFALIGLFSSQVAYTPLDLLIPIGVSFFTFKLVSYLVDVYRENIPVERHLGYFALYVTSFPQLLAGPIDRAGQLIPELKKRITFDIERILSGVRLITWGIFKKMVIADRLAIFVNEVFKSPEHQGLNLIFAAYFYAFQVYCDFSGYSDMAIGISRVLGFRSMNNFDYPYFAKSITHFWNKWHISLSTWLRDYLFLPIAYAVMRPIKTPKLYHIKVETWGYVVGMFITMFLGGLWHGASWTFVAWGTLHGLYLIIGYTTKKSRKQFVKRIKLNQLPRLRHFLSVFITFNLVSFAWIFFRADSFATAFTFIKHISLNPTGHGSGYLWYNIILVLLFILAEWVYKKHEQWKILQRVPEAFKFAAFALFICLIIILSVDTANEFIYTQF